jgi:hypothetical protein
VEVPADRFARKIVRILTVLAVRSRRLKANRSAAEATRGFFVHLNYLTQQPRSKS